MIQGPFSWTFLVLVQLLISRPVFNQLLYNSCSDIDGVSNYNPNTPFHNNLINLLRSLPINTAQNNGFYSTSLGNGLDQASVRALCRGDVISADICRGCLENASQEITKNCSKEAAITWLDKCQIEYSYGTLSTIYTGKYPVLNSETASDQNQFCSALKDLEVTLSNKASGSKLMFAEGQRKFSTSETLYGLFQCTRDISQEECGSCLRQAFGDLNGCESNKGGAVLSRTCNVRFELYKFYDDSPHTGSSHTKGRKVKLIVAVAAASICGIAVLIALIGLLVHKQRTNKSHEAETSQTSIFPMNITKRDEIISDPQELPFTEFSIIKAATNNFSALRKLGEGGFGTVYKGVMPDGNEVAVKRLSRRTWQGPKEFRNEISLIAKLQHRNLVRLLSFGTEGSEMLLIYEYMPLKSLDIFLFDVEKRKLLDWNKRMNIIRGIAKGLKYLHEESRVKIVHRDLKPSNVLLDNEMLAKISDFGMARIFCDDQDTGNTKKVVGTVGYMAPEYALNGEFSFKSDVFSFGVILLELISGKKNSEFRIVEHAWKMWNEGKELEVIDPILTESFSMQEFERCVFIGLSCVQENQCERPMMSDVVIFLESPETLPEPRKPAGPVGAENRVVIAIRESSSAMDADGYTAGGSSSTADHSVNQMTVSTMAPR